MFAWFFKALAVLQGLLEMWKRWQEYQTTRREALAEEKRQALEAAVEESKNAETEEDIWKSQEKIVENKP